jgi:putative oxidoreductase
MLNNFLFGKSDSLNSSFSHLALLGLRLFIGLSMAFAHGLGKMPPEEMFIGYLGSMGLPFPILLAWMAALAEFVGGILIAIGFLTRPAALSLVVTMAVAAFMAHAADPYAKKEMALVFMTVFAFIFVTGAGKFALDNKISLRK